MNRIVFSDHVFFLIASKELPGIFRGQNQLNTLLLVVVDDDYGDDNDDDESGCKIMTSSSRSSTKFSSLHPNILIVNF